jgi:hypothetical protein
MGWDVSAISADGTHVCFFPEFPGMNLATISSSGFQTIPDFEFHDQAIMNAFEEAVNTVMQNTGGRVDRYLLYGGLDLDGSVEMLQRITNKPIDHFMEWDVRYVQDIPFIRNWSFPVDMHSISEYWSARMFLEVCIQNFLGVKFF